MLALAVALLPVQAFDVDEVIKNPAILKELYGDLSSGLNGLRRKGDTRREDAVMRTLRWLKLNQDADGAWGNDRIAMTGLAVLTFCAHGELPNDSVEFGDSIRKGVEYLLSKQQADGRFEGADACGYAHPIAAYSLCEVYGMTLNPNVWAAAKKAIAVIIAGQHPTGGWDCRLDAKPGKDGQCRDDICCAGWCVQALMSARRNRLQLDGLDQARRLALKGLKANAAPEGGFAYTGADADCATATATFCMMLLGAWDSQEVKRSLGLMKNWLPSDAGADDSSLCYRNYYATLCKFYTPSQWHTWNKAMMPFYATACWEGKGGDPDRTMTDTCLTVLQLSVYYAFRPRLYKVVGWGKDEPGTEEGNIHADR